MNPYNTYLMCIRTGIGQAIHRFLPNETTKPCVIAGIIFDGAPGLDADSDGDVVFHAICNAISSVTGVPILTGIAADLCQKDGITDSQVYLEKALLSLEQQQVEHLALSIEGKRPALQSRILEMRQQIARVLKLDLSQVGLTATSGDGLTNFSLGEGLHCLCVITTKNF
jgi:2-C-methyl-D-erythritol 2,4-cyclodiphosphate synthase